MGLAALWKKFRGEENFTCDVCGREVFAGERVCEACLRALPFHRKICPLCGREVREEGVCAECKKEPLAAPARSAFEHEGEAARLVVRFKRGSRYLARTLAELSAPVFKKEFPSAEALVPVPMTEADRKRRGYNQSEEFAAELGRLCGLPLLPAAVKTKRTGSQKFLGRRERAENLEGCFHISDRKGVRGKRLAVVDDTMTTGATSSELVRALLRAGAKEVAIFTFTAVTDKHPFGKPPSEK